MWIVALFRGHFGNLQRGICPKVRRPASRIKGGKHGEKAQSARLLGVGAASGCLVSSGIERKRCPPSCVGLEGIPLRRVWGLALRGHRIPDSAPCRPGNLKRVDDAVLHRVFAVARAARRSITSEALRVDCGRCLRVKRSLDCNLWFGVAHTNDWILSVVVVVSLPRPWFVPLSRPSGGKSRTRGGTSSWSRVVRRKNFYLFAIR